MVRFGSFGFLGVCRCFLIIIGGPLSQSATGNRQLGLGSFVCESQAAIAVVYCFCSLNDVEICGFLQTTPKDQIVRDRGPYGGGLSETNPPGVKL